MGEPLVNPGYTLGTLWQSLGTPGYPLGKPWVPLGTLGNMGIRLGNLLGGPLLAPLVHFCLSLTLESRDWIGGGDKFFNKFPQAP